jgi:hypothetical protein
VDDKKAWLVLISGFAAFIPVYVLVGYFALRGQEPSESLNVPIAVWAVAAVVVVTAAASVARIASAPGNDPTRFRVLSFVAFGILEAGAVAGLVATFLLRRMEPVVVLAAAGVAGVAAFVVPSGLAYFRARESRRAQALPLGPS